MIIAFCGHSQFFSTDTLREQLLSFLERIAGDSPTELYLGGYGGFDEFARQCGRIYQKEHPNTKLILVTPYLTESYQKNHLSYAKNQYDEIVYPPIESVPLRFAISHRNRFMIEKADHVVAYVEFNRGGAFETYQHAIRKKKPIFNLAKL